jgi:aminopeptidase
MTDIRLEKLAQLIVNYSVKVRSGDKVAIYASSIAEPLIKEVYKNVLHAGGHPFIMVSPGGIEDILFKNASDEQLKYVHEPVKYIMEHYDVRISIASDDNTRELSQVDSSRIVLHRQARTELNKIFMERSASGALRWVVTLFPTNAYAQDAGMSLSDYEDFVYSACLPDMDDPVGYWQRFSVWQDGIIEWLKAKENVHIVGPDTDLRLSIKDRIFVNCDGRFNMPDGEIFTGPVEDSIDGYVTFSYPSHYSGREVTGVRLQFEHGKVIQAHADKDEEFLIKTLDTDNGARYIGEFAIGTNEGINRFTGEILFDEKINGSFHMALGAGYPETGSKNESAIHWDMICDLRQGGEIRVDGELLYRDGKFAIPV